MSSAALREAFSMAVMRAPISAAEIVNLGSAPLAAPFFGIGLDIVAAILRQFRVGKLNKLNLGMRTARSKILRVVEPLAVGTCHHYAADSSRSDLP